MRRKRNYVMVKLVMSKRVTLPNGRTFIVQYKRIKRSELPLHIVMRELIHKELLLMVERGGEEERNRDRAFLIFKKMLLKTP